MAGKIGYAARMLRVLAADEKAQNIADRAQRLSKRQEQITDSARTALQKPRSRGDVEKQAWQDQQEFNEQASRNLQRSLGELAELADTERGRTEALQRHLEHRELDLARHRRHQSERNELATEKNQHENANDCRMLIGMLIERPENLRRVLKNKRIVAREELLRNQLASTPSLRDAQREAGRVENALKKADRQPLNEKDAKQTGRFPTTIT